MASRRYLIKPVKILLIYIIIALAITVTLLNIACTSTEPPPSIPVPTPSQSPSPSQSSPESPISSVIEWKADGNITAGEYGNNKSYDDLIIHWIIDEQFIYMAIQAKTSGWIAVALQPGQLMKDADMVLGFIKDGEVFIFDQYSTGNFGPHTPDSELGGTDDIADFGGKEENGFTTIEFKRKLETDDKYDHPFSKGANKIIWAWGTDDNKSLKHSKRGYGEIDL